MPQMREAMKVFGNEASHWCTISASFFCRKVEKWSVLLKFVSTKKRHFNLIGQ